MVLEQVVLEQMEPGDRSWDRYIDLTPGEGLEELAGFVVESTILQAGLVPDDPGNPQDVVRRSYELLAGKHLRYRREALDDYGDQVVRPWSRMQFEGGTCLDLALLACIQLVACDLRPLVAVSYGGGQENHAVVLVDLAATVSEPSTFTWPVGASPHPGPTARPWSPQELGPSWLIYDPTEACGPVAAPFDRAQHTARERLGDHVWLVDVLPARQLVGQRTPPAPLAPGLLTQRYPAPPELVELDSRTDVTARLQAATGISVIIGDRGAGKSALALQSAHRGAGWFLLGSSKQALLSSLAEQEGGERGIPDTVVATDVDGYAQAARQRLTELTGPWRVVVDNADVEASDLDVLLPRPNPGAGQHLIITTTNRTAEGEDADWTGWAARHSARVEFLEPLREAEVGDFLRAIGAAPLDLRLEDPRVRQPLMLRALGSFARETGIVALDPALSPQEAYWARLAPVLRQEGLLALAHAMALLPPVPVPPRVMTALEGADASGARRLRDLGLLSRSEADWNLHGSLAEVIRADAAWAIEAPRLAASLLRANEVCEHISSAFDKQVVNRFRSALAASTLSDDHAVPAISRLATIVDQRGTAEDASDIAKAGLLRTEGSTGNTRALFLLGAARYVNQHHAEAARQSERPELEVIEEALEQVREAQRVASNGEVKYTAQAMEGLLTKAQAKTATAHQERALRAEAEASINLGLRTRALAVARENATVPDERAAGLRKAELLILDSRDNRQQSEPLLRAKALFNVSGISLELAKDEPESRAERLEAARKAYQEVGDVRRGVYRTTAHRHVASCTAGEGMIDFYDALLRGLSRAAPRQAGPADHQQLQDATRMLHRATDRLVASLHERQLLEPDADGGDVVKSLQLLGKTILLRLALARGSLDGVLGRNGLVLELFDEIVRFSPALAQRYLPTPDETEGEQA